MSKKAIIGAFLGGAAVGAVSLFFAPKKGSELRQDAQEKFVEAKEKAQIVIEKYRNKENTTEESNIVVENVVSEEVEEAEEETAVDNPLQ